VDEAARSRALPPLVLQPLVENALAHGIGSRLTGGTIRITVRAGESLTIRVKDDGPGFPARWKEGTGLGNLRERLHAIYGERAALDVAREADGAQVTVTLPDPASQG
jgi:LytS/YehU family sensor histidine kinase